MAQKTYQYSGQITLVNVMDGTDGADANGIVSTIISYMASINGTTPPDFSDSSGNNINFTTEDGDILTFTDVNATFKIVENFLYASYNDSLLKIIENEGILEGIQSTWSETIPEVPAGYFLWTKTIFTYTDGTKVISYNVSRNGENGLEGPQGPAGPSGKDANVFQIVTNQEEILKFVDKGNKLIFSPEELVIQIKKIEENITIQDLNREQLTLSVYDTDKGNWIIFKEIAQDSSNSSGEEQKPIIILKDDSFTFKLSDFNSRFSANNLDNLFSEKESILLIEYIHIDDNNKEYYLTKALSFRFGMNKDMASLSLEANGIFQSIQNTKLEFTANGLKIKNGGFKIVGNEEEELLTSQDGNLKIKGEIYATSGNFQGDINATGGQIGGFLIEGNSLKSTDRETSINLNGADGEIIAKKIVIGTGAIIEDYIKLGNAKIQNPGEGNTIPFIQAGSPSSLEIYTDGKIILGKQGEQIILNPTHENSLGFDGTVIELDGKNTCIFGTNFSITPELATFSNINCSGKITTVTFEKNKVQSVGGSMVFKPRFEVDQIDIASRKITLKDVQNEIAVGNYLWLIDDSGNLLNNIEKYWVESIDSNDSRIIYINKMPPENLRSFILIGSDSDAIIGINTQTDAILNKMYGQGLTISTYGNTGLPELFLGNLANLKSYFSGYGLYSSNVFLNGSLTTKSTTDKYAGVNTLSGVPATQFDGSQGRPLDTSNIIFWAGSKSTETPNIQEAPFQVTEAGYVYAKSAVLEESVFTNGSISGADIYAARIHGGKEGSSAALTFYDTKYGISFRTGYGTADEKETFTINNSGFYIGDSPFISIIDNNVEFYGNTFNINKLLTKQVGSEEAFLSFTNPKQMVINVGANKKCEINSSEIIFQDTIKYSDSMEYRVVEGGYDLYVK